MRTPSRKKRDTVFDTGIPFYIKPLETKIVFAARANRNHIGSINDYLG